MLCFTSFASANVIATFEPQPASPGVAELIWNQNQLYEGPGTKGTGWGSGPGGSYGAGDGQLPVSSQFPGGLTIKTPFLISGLPGGVPNQSNGSTSFYDTTLLVLPTDGNVYGLPAVGTTSTTIVPGVPGVVLFSQLLGAGDFQVWTTCPTAAPYTPTLLLGGTINNAVITGLLGSSSGSVISANITFSSGAILDAAGGQPGTGQLSWSLLDADPLFQISARNANSRQFRGRRHGPVRPVRNRGSRSTLKLIPIALLGFWQWQRRKGVKG